MSALVNIAVPLGAAAIAGASAIAGQWNGGRNEKTKWLREQRLAIYSDFLDLVHRAAVAGSKDTGATSVAARAALNRVRVIGPEDVADAATSCYAAMLEAEKAGRSWDESRIYEGSDAERVVNDYHQAEKSFAKMARATVS